MNQITLDFKWDIDYNYYIEQANKLLDVLNNEDDIKMERL